MHTDDGPENDDRARQPPARRVHSFAIRLWNEEVTGGTELRGRVEDVHNGAYRGFRAWPDLIAFMLTRIDETEHSTPQAADTDRRLPSSVTRQETRSKGVHDV